MGKYINVLPDNTPLRSSFYDKIQQLSSIKGATVLSKAPSEFVDNLVCIVNNGIFAAAGYCYDQEEFEAFNYPGDDRPKKWMIIPGVKEIAK